MNNKNNKQENYKKVSCPFCKGKEIVKRGTFQTEAHGKQQRYFCKNCNKKFIERTGFYRMRNNGKKITLSIDLFYRGVSTRKVQEHLKAFYPHNASHKSIYKWVIKYSKMISKFTDNLKLNVGYELQIDEMQYSRRKYPDRKGVDTNWFIDCIDSKTRFMVSSEYVKSRGQEELKSVLINAKNKTTEQIKIITSDGLMAYPNAIHKSFTLIEKSNTKKYGVRHNQVNASRGEGFNIMIERLHNNIRARTKTFRGFHGSVSSANSIMKGYAIYYNFITKHQTLKRCPYELAIPELKEKLNNPNKWLSLIELSNQSI
ncbi:MAG: DDE-type integrase/transposase/recombinase [Nanoarchaeota archaeon]|nr:DDE-type integrase/transposase/recombinase [Nanoarchaeota archaeon]